jgi:hypothetical protein
LIYVNHDDWKAFLYRLAYRSQPKPTGYRALLCNGAALTPQSTMAQIAAQELSGDGYSRQVVELPSDGAMASGRWGDEVDLEWTVTAAKNWRYLVIVANATAVVGNTTGVPVVIGTLPAVETIIANSPRELVAGLRIG